MNQASLGIQVAHFALTTVVGGAWLFAFHRAGLRHERLAQLAFGAWLLLTLLLANQGALLAPEASPPRLAFLMVPGALAMIALAASPLGARMVDNLSLSWIVLTQVFRLPVELILWQLHREGVLPVQMTFEGQNFDVVTALLAPLVALACRKRSVTWLVLAWNVVGLVLLARIMYIAVRSMPGPWRTYANEPANTIVLTSAFVWIPTVYVLSALGAHLLVFRALLRRRARAS